MHVQLGRVTRITFDGARIANPDGWPSGGDFATAQHLAISVRVGPLLRHRQVVLPMIALDHPAINAEQLADGRSNWTFNLGGGGGGGTTEIGTVQIADGTVHFVDPRLRADFQLAVETKDQPGGASTLHATAQGTYAGQPIQGEFTGGALRSLRDRENPYPVDLHIANGPTRASIEGTVENPLSFKGAKLKLALEGPDMQSLYALTGIATPPTPPYKLAGNFDYQAGHFSFTDATGTLGRSDIHGDLSVVTTGEKPVLNATLASRQIDLQDLGGFIGGTPGTANEPGQTPQQRTQLAHAEAGSKLLPDTKVSLPKLNAVDVHLHYKADHIIGRKQPLDSMGATLDIDDGAVALHPLDFTIGGGRVTGQIALKQEQAGLHARADIEFQRIPVDKLLATAGVGRGAGTIAGRAVIEGTGSSLAAIVGHGNGEMRLYMGRGGDVSALLVDLSGLEFGNALLSAIGVPRRDTIECLIAIAKLRDGVLRPDPLLLDTSSALTTVTGEANLLTEKLAIELQTKAKHFTIGSLPAPIRVGGTLKSPSIAPDVGSVAPRAAAAVALGVVLTPLAALIPTIQLGTGETGACSGLARAKEAPQVPPREPARQERGRRR